jgi:hypothetical protein
VLFLGALGLCFARPALAGPGPAPLVPRPQPTVAPSEPTINALRAQSVVLSALALLDDSTGHEAQYVGYALTHQLYTCVAYWPPGVVPTTDEASAYCSSSEALAMHTLTPGDVAWVLSHIPVYAQHGVR